MHFGGRVEAEVTKEAFLRPKEARTEAHITGRFG